jgi:mannose-6-phosphate isomerase-like protein (cupin superfamily)
VTQGAFSLIETVEPAAGLGPPLHVHRDCAESFLVLAGRYRMHLDDAGLDAIAERFEMDVVGPVPEGYL